VQMNRRIYRFVGFQPDTLLKEAPAVKRGVIPNSKFRIPNSVHFDFGKLTFE
jgi:hypothetical protein